MTKNQPAIVAELRKLEIGDSLILSDSIQAGVTIVRGPRGWVVIDLETGKVSSHERIVLITAGKDVNSQQMTKRCLGCNLEGDEPLWLFDGKSEMLGGTVVWDSARG